MASNIHNLLAKVIALDSQKASNSGQSPLDSLPEAFKEKLKELSRIMLVTSQLKLPETITKSQPLVEGQQIAGQVLKAAADKPDHYQVRILNQTLDLQIKTQVEPGTKFQLKVLQVSPPLFQVILDKNPSAAITEPQVKLSTAAGPPPTKEQLAAQIIQQLKQQPTHSAVVSRVFDSQRAEITIGNQKVFVTTPEKLNVGAQILLRTQVDQSGKLQLAVVSSRPTPPDLSAQIRELLPKQHTPTNLIASALKVEQMNLGQKTDQSPVQAVLTEKTALKQAISELTKYVAKAELNGQKNQADTIKNLIQNSGLFMENKFQTALTSGTLAAPDLKSLLQRVASIIRQQIGSSAESSFKQTHASPPLKGFLVTSAPPVNINQLNLPGRVEQLLRELLSQTESSLARIQLSQIGSAQQPIDNSTWHFDIPFLLGEELSMIHLRIEEQLARENNDSDDPNAGRLWNILLSFNIGDLGPFYAKVNLLDDNVRAHFWSDNESTTKALNEKLDYLESRLSEHDLNVTNLSCSTGQPNEVKHSAPSSNKARGGLIDERQ